MVESTVEAADEWLHSFYYYNDEMPTEQDFLTTIADYLTFEFNMVTHGRGYLFEKKEECFFMLQLSDREWAEFDIHAVFPEIRRGKRLKTADHIDGNIPYVSSSAMNNGVDAFIGNDGHIRKYENCITLANSGSVGTAFYHCYEFIASDHVTALQSSKLNKYSYLFIATMVSRLQGKYSFNREINDLRINREKVLLPVDEEGKPDYAFMEEYIKEREQQLIQKYIAHVRNTSVTIGGITPLHEKDWRCFVLGDLFTLIPGKGKGANLAYYIIPARQIKPINPQKRPLFLRQFYKNDQNARQSRCSLYRTFTSWWLNSSWTASKISASQPTQAKAKPR